MIKYMKFLIFSTLILLSIKTLGEDYYYTGESDYFTAISGKRCLIDFGQTLKIGGSGSKDGLTMFEVIQQEGECSGERIVVLKKLVAKGAVPDGGFSTNDPRLDNSPTFGSSVSEDKLNAYINQCVRLPPSELLERGFQNKIKTEKRKAARHGRKVFKSKYTRYNELMETLRSSHIAYIDIDGFRMEKISPKELEILLELTSHRDFHSILFGKDYTMTIEDKDRILFIKRECVRGTCIRHSNRKLSYVFNLESVKNTEPLCKGVLCASKRIFGDPKGIYLVYAMDRYGISLSRYSDVSADPEGLELEDLKSVLIGLDTTPRHLYTKTLEGQTFYRFLKGLVKRGHSHTASAAAEGPLYDNFLRSKRPCGKCGP